jgi:hypothetical protein
MLLQLFEVFQQGALAYKWGRILWRCWKDNNAYDEEKYLAVLDQGKKYPQQKR